MSFSRIPGRTDVENFVNRIFELLFPSADPGSGSELTGDLTGIRNELLLLITGLKCNSSGISDQFIESLPALKENLLRDANFILDSDPAATDLIEVIAIYPGVFAIYSYRLANFLHRMSLPLFPRMITEYAHRRTGIDIHPAATIGNPVSIDHGTGIVIGETAEIGNYVKMYQGVTIGALSVDKGKASRKRHPTIEDNVILYSGCTILGGQTVVGRNSIIGGNVWLTESVAPYSVVYHKSDIVVRNQPGFNEPLNFNI